jgi:cellulose synthase/poly-beta-1,6-N-acetylglucosamine synthase-like glycosyltransferase
MMKVLLVINVTVFAYFVALNAVYLITSLAAFVSLRRYARRLRVVDVEDLILHGGPPPVTLLAPGYNEQATCVESLRSLLTLRYPQYEVIFINDGSKDQTLQRVIDAFALKPAVRAPTAALSTAPVRGIYHGARHPNLWVIDKANGGKADALNAGINFCRTPLFCAIDADSLLEREALIRIIRPFLEDTSTVAAGGIIRIANGCTIEHGVVREVNLPQSRLARLQVLEYLRAFLAGRMGWGALNAMLIISGAFGIFRRDLVVEAGGYSTDTVGEDMELVVRLHHLCRRKRMKYRIAFVPDPVAWTECPETLRILGRQRDRWQRGLIESMWRHRTMLLNVRYGRIGLLAYPYFFFLEMLGPLVEVAGYIAFVFTLVLWQFSGLYILGFLMVAVVLGMVLSAAAVALEELTFRRYSRMRDLLKLFGLAIVENLGYRQINSYWRIRGFASKLLKRNAWGAMTRKGFSTGTARP